MTQAPVRYPFSQVDVFAPGPKAGNPVAVVHDADGLSTDQMQSFANWTNLSETTFLLQPSEAGADYKVRIFTPKNEIPFAGHPTLGSAYAWLEQGWTPKADGHLVQECGAGLVKVRRDGVELSFEAPPLTKSGALEPEVFDQLVASLRIDREQVLACNWIDNGPGWLGVRLGTAQEILDLEPDFTVMGQLNIGVIGAYDDGGPADFEVRAFAPGHDVQEDPVTGSVNAGLAQWLLEEGVVKGNYTVQQGTTLGRGGRLSITVEPDAVWVGGISRVVVSGHVLL